MSIKKSVILLGAAMTMTAVMSGCSSSSKDGGSASDVPKVSEGTCLTCHSTAVDSVAGTPIVSAYLASKHYTNNFHVVGCQDCHGGGAGHNGVGPIPFSNPDTAGQCFSCHKNYLPKAHFRNMTAGADAFSSAMYVTTNYEKSCTSCHDPHKADKGITQQHTDWAASGHGDVNGVAWATEDFKENASCIRCHTATGFIDYVSSSFTLPTASFASSTDKGREVLTCKACHTTYNFENRVRNVGKFTAPYGIVNNVATVPVGFENVGTSNMCVACHSGREGGGSLDLITNFTNASFKNPHYLAEAAVFYGKGGFQFYTSNARYNRYAAERVGANAGWSHGKIGINNYVTGANAEKVAANVVATGTSGQCVACHLGAGPVAGNHTLDAYAVAKGTWTATQKGCYGCHGTEDMEEVGTLEKALFDRGMAFFQYNLLQNGIKYTDVYPYFQNTDGTTMKNWTRSNSITPVGPVAGSGKQNMGVAMNFKLLAAAKGSHVHNRAFSRALMADSIVYLQNGAVGNRSVSSTDPNGIMNFTNYSTALAATPDTIINPALSAPSNGGIAGQMVSISQLKGWILRKTGANYTRR